MGSVLNTTAHDTAALDIVSASGPYVVDSAGRRYLDLESGTWCTVLGHSHPAVSSVIASQADQFMHAGFDYSSSVLERTAERVLALTGQDGGACVFLCSGSEAIEVCRQVARHLSGKPLSMTMHDSYLGAYSSVADRRTGWYVFDWTRCADCHHAANGRHRLNGSNDTDESGRGVCDPECSNVADIPPDISDFVFEPGSSSGFVRFPPVALIPRIVDAVRAGGGYVIANEVTTGTGRTGRWFGYQHYGIQPDMVAIGKGIGNGYPVSIAAFSAGVVERLRNSGFKYAQSHQNDPLGAAVAATVIDTITTEHLIERSARVGARLLAQLTTLVDGDVVTGVRGRGMMICVDLSSRELADALHRDLRRRGYLVGNRGTAFRIDPPLSTDQALLDDFVATFRLLAAESHAFRSHSG